MKHTKLVMLGVLTSSLYASGFYGGVDIGVSIVRSKSDGSKSGVEFAGNEVKEEKNNRKSKVKLNPGIFIGCKINSEANGGGVELSFNARKEFPSHKMMSNDLSMYFSNYREQFSGTLKGFVSHKFNSIDAYIVGGVAVKNIKYTSMRAILSEHFEIFDSYNLMAIKKKTHITPVIGCGANIPFNESWFVRCEYTFEFPVKVSLSPGKVAGGGISGRQYVTYGNHKINHKIHNVRFGIGRMF